MTYWHLFILSIFISFDAFFIGIIYGIKGSRFYLITNMIVFITSFLMSLLSLSFGSFIANFLPIWISSLLSSLLFCIIGIKAICSNSLSEPIIIDCKTSYFDNLKEAFLISVGVSYDAFASGISLGIAGEFNLAFPIFVAIFHALFINCGVILGKKIRNTAKISTNIGSIISGVSLILFGCLRLLF